MAQTDRQKSLTIIFSALALGQVAFLGVVLAIQRSVAPPEGLDAMTLPIVAVVIVLSAIVGSLQVGRALAAAAAGKPDEVSRWQAFQAAVIVRLALLEGASIAMVALYLVTGEWLFLALFTVSFGAFFFQRPRPEQWEAVSSGAVS